MYVCMYVYIYIYRERERYIVKRQGRTSNGQRRSARSTCAARGSAGSIAYNDSMLYYSIVYCIVA